MTPPRAGILKKNEMEGEAECQTSTAGRGGRGKPGDATISPNPPHPAFDSVAHVPGRGGKKERATHRKKLTSNMPQAPHGVFSLCARIQPPGGAVKTVLHSIFPRTCPRFWLARLTLGFLVANRD